MAFIQQESSFQSHVRPPRKRYLGFIPGPRPSSARGYAQALDPVWGEYREAQGGTLARRSHMKHATDFIGWYNARSQRQAGISLRNPEHLYLAYHEGGGGLSARHLAWQARRAARRPPGLGARRPLSGAAGELRGGVPVPPLLSGGALLPRLTPEEKPRGVRASGRRPGRRRRGWPARSPAGRAARLLPPRSGRGLHGCG